MEKQINKITNKMIDSIALNNGNLQNSICIEIPLSYALELVNINWNDILFGISNGYFSNAAAIEYAIILLGEHNNEVKVLDLACLNLSEITKEALLLEYINELANGVSEKEKEETKDKIMYVLLRKIFDNKEIFENPLYVVELVYSDFDYPKLISNFVRYMPPDNPREYGIKQIYKNWEEYLSSQKIRFNP